MQCIPPPHSFIISLIEFRGVNTGRLLQQFLVSSFPASSQNQNRHQGEYPCCLHITISLICPISPTVVSTITRIPKKAKESLKPPVVADRAAKALNGLYCSMRKHSKNPLRFLQPKDFHQLLENHILDIYSIAVSHHAIIILTNVLSPPHSPILNQVSLSIGRTYR